MNFLVIEGLDGAALDGNGEFRLAQGIIDASGLGVLVDALLCGSIEFLAIGGKCKIRGLIQCGFANFDESLVGFISDGEDIDELRL